MRRTLLTVLIAACVLIITAAPASAHSVNGQGSTNFKGRIRSVTPRVAGLKVEIIEAGSRISVTNHTGQTVTVLGYQGEPYLRVGKDGVFQNRRSPAVSVNSVRNNPPPVPPDADPSAKPVWVRLGGGDVVRWHDHRAHWMGSQNPLIVRREPGKFHVVTRLWRLGLVVGSQRVSVSGDLVWVPGPSPLPWVLLALVGAGVVVVGAFTRAWRPTLVGATALVVAADVVHTAGVAFGSQSGSAIRIITTTPYSLVAWAVGVVGIVLLFRQPLAGLYTVSFAAIVIGVLGGLSDVSDLYHSQVASGVGTTPIRIAIALSIGLAVGIPVASYIAVKRGHVPRVQREPDQPVAVPAPSPT